MKKMICLILVLVMLPALPAQAADALGQVLLGDAAQTSNAMLAASAMDGLRLEFGETFSFNDTVGPRTEAAGYVPALNGRSVEVVGGGCAQAASAVYLALCSLAPGAVSFDELSFYGDRYTGSYVSDGSQAVLVDYANGRDFRFTNLSSGALTLTFTQADGSLVCTAAIEEAPAAEEFSFKAAEEFTSQAAAPLFASGGIDLYCGDDPAVISNVSVAAASVHDTVLMSGDEFSFNHIVGPRSEDFGYVYATNGRGVEVMGGGCAQVASALWLMIENNPDFVVVEKATYGEKYNQTYVDSGDEAILVDYTGGQDFCFRYVGPGSVTIYAVVQDNVLTVSNEK